MMTTSFDATLDLSILESGLEYGVDLVFEGASAAATVHVYAGPGLRGGALARITTDRALDVRWMDRFEVRSRSGGLAGPGTVLLPDSPDPKKLKSAKRLILLERLSKGEKEMILALAEERGIHGLRDGEIIEFCRLSGARVESLARLLEEDDEVRILSFSPLFLVSRSALDFLRERIIDFLARFHQGHPDRKGVEREKIAKRFGPPDKILSLVIRTLEKSGRLRSEGDLVWLADFQFLLRPEDEEVLGRLETMVYKGEFAAASLEDIRRELRLSERRLQTLLSVLTERKKIVEGKDGFLLHSKWLDDIVKTIRESGKRELTVAEFKVLTGLSRKYTIPLLEFLDEMGVTRRRGSVRDIL